MGFCSSFYLLIGQMYAFVNLFTASSVKGTTEPSYSHFSASPSDETFGKMILSRSKNERDDN
ncbi:hypothetical protein ACTXT7_015281 [Hymenolepis weldensis]